MGTDATIAELGRDESLRLLADHDVGRLVVVEEHRPLVFPVNYVLDGDAVVFRTDPGTKLSKGPRARASFEIDAFDPVSLRPRESRHASSRQNSTGDIERVDTLPEVRPIGAVSPSSIWSPPCPLAASPAVAAWTRRR